MPGKKGSPPLQVSEKVCYGVGDASNGLALSAMSLWFFYYMTAVIGLGPMLVGLAVTIGRLWDAVTDPLMGWITDHTNTRWGKRRPYLLFGALPYALSFLALWTIPNVSNQYLIFAYVTIVLIVFNTCLTVVFVPYTSLTAAITSDYDERTSITGFRIASSQTAFLVGAALPPLFVQFVESSAGQEFLGSWGINAFFGSLAGTAQQGYVLVAALFAGLMVASIWIAFAGTQERDVEKRGACEKSGRSPLSYATTIAKELFNNRPYLISVLILLFSNCAATLAATNLPFYLESVVHLKEHNSSIVLMLFLSGILAVPLWVFLAKRFGKAETYTVGGLCYVFVLLSLVFIPPGNLLLTRTMAVLVGVFYSATITIPWAIIPDIVEYDELRTGQRREGLFYGGTTFCYKAATGLAFLISAAVLALVDYQPQPVQPLIVVKAIRGLMGPGAAIFLLIGVFLATKHPITADKHGEILKELEQRRAQDNEQGQGDDSQKEEGLQKQTASS